MRGGSRWSRPGAGVVEIAVMRAEDTVGNGTATVVDHARAPTRGTTATTGRAARGRVMFSRAGGGTRPPGAHSWKVSRTARPAIQARFHTMPNLLAKLTALGLIGSGFAATGDLGWIAERGRRVLDAADVAAPSTRAQAEPQPGVKQDYALPPPAPVAPSAPALPARPAAPVALHPPAGGPQQIAWAGIAAGDRIVVWLSAGGPRCLVLDVVDPATAEALAYDAAAVSPAGQPLMAAGPPRRVVVGRRTGESGLAVGGMISLASAGIAAHGEGSRWLGPIEALLLIN